jgi:ParB family chromosome partitioning protein
MARTSRLQEIPLTDIQPNPDQPRKTFDEDALAELAASIESHGLIQPIVVAEVVAENGDGFTIVAGERRYRAVQSLDWEEVSVLVIEDGKTDELALIENVQREDLHPIEEAEAMKGLMKRHGYTQKVLAGVIGKARSTVANTLKLNQLPASIKEECRGIDGVPKSVLFELAGLPVDERLGFWEELKKNGFTVQQARRRKKLREPRPPSEAPAAVRLLRAGKTFQQRLRAYADEMQDGEIEEGHLDLLEEIHQQIGEVLDSLGEDG